MKQLLIRALYFSIHLLYIPVYAGMCFFKKKNRFSFLYRLGLKKESLFDLDEGFIWIHAVSLGEVNASLNLAKQIKQEACDRKILCSCITEAGYDRAKKQEQFDKVIYLPFDLFFLVRNLLKKLNPSAFISVEGDLWPELLFQLKEKKIPVFVVNGKISERSYNRSLKILGLSAHLFLLVDLFLLQNEDYLKRFLSLGVDKTNLIVTGNIKYDFSFRHLKSHEILALKESLKIKTDEKICLIASTHENEEVLILNSVKSHLKKMKFIVVPRHQPRFLKVYDELVEQGFSCSLLSNLDEAIDIIVVDQMGILIDLYQICDIAIVGGSFVAVGGHNIFEPIYFKKPTVFGPFMDKQKDFKKAAIENRFGMQITADELSAVLDCFYQNQLNINFENLENFLSSSQGATERNWGVIKKYLNI